MWPGIAVEIGEEAVVGLAVDVNRPGEGSLRKDRFHLRAGPVLSPLIEKLQLSLAEKNEAGEIDGAAVVGRVVDVIGARAHFRDFPLRAGLELPVFEDGEINFPDTQACEVYGDPAIDGLRVIGIRKMPGLLPLHHIHILRSIEIASCRSGRSFGNFSAFSPEIGLADVVVVRDRDRGAVLCQLAIAKAPFDPAGGVLRVMIGLVSGEKENIRILRKKVLPDVGTVPLGPARITGEARHDDLVFVDRVPADQSLVDGILPVAHTVGDIFGPVPALDAEMCTPAGENNFLGRGSLPLIPVFEFEQHFAGLVLKKRVKLRAELEDAAVLRVEREGDDVLARHVEIDQPLRGAALFVFSSLSLRLFQLVRGLLPPFAGGSFFQHGKFFTKGKGRSCPGDAPRQKQGKEGSEGK